MSSRRWHRSLAPALFILVACSKSPAPPSPPSPGEIPSPDREISLKPQQLRFDYTGIAKTIRVERRPASRLKARPALGTQANPAELMFVLDPATLPDPALPEVRALIVYPAIDWSRTYARLGLAGDDPLPLLKQALDDEPPDFSAQMPMAAGHIGAHEVFRAGTHYLEFKAGHGVRYLTVYQSDPLPLTSADVVYVFHGLTADDKYWVTLNFPLGSHLLPPSDAAMAALSDYDQFVAGQAAYLEGIRKRLAAARPEDFTPRLDRLDAMIESLEINSR